MCGTDRLRKRAKTHDLRVHPPRLDIGRPRWIIGVIRTGQGPMNVFDVFAVRRRSTDSSLIDGLLRAHVEIEHSPRNPLDGDDPRWENWYEVGLPAALARCILFVAVIDRGWDSSSWMAHEAEVATKRSLPVLYWNPEGLSVAAPGMLPYLRREEFRRPSTRYDLLLRRTPDKPRVAADGACATPLNARSLGRLAELPHDGRKASYY